MTGIFHPLLSLIASATERELAKYCFASVGNGGYLAHFGRCQNKGILRSKVRLGMKRY